MQINAKIISNDDELTPDCTGLYGARFYSACDPVNEKNKVVKIYTVNTTHTISSTTNVEGKSLCDSPTAFVFEMKYYFEKIWYYSPKYFRIEFCNNANATSLTIMFNVKEGEPNTSASCLNFFVLGDSDNEKIELYSDRWYDIKFEYYKGIDSLTNSVLKIFVKEKDGKFCLLRQMKLNGKTEIPTRALLIHNATKIRGVQYLDDLSFTLCDKPYSPDASSLNIPKESKKVYDFEDGIPSEKRFYVDMRLKKIDDFLSMDPASWNGAGKNSFYDENREEYEVLLVQTGEAMLITATEQTPIYEGSIVIIPPKTKFDITSKVKYNIISLDGNFEQLGCFTEPTVLHDNIYSEGKKLAELALYNRFNNEEYFTSLCNCFINFILLNHAYPKNDMNAIVYKMMDQIKKNYDNSEFSVIKMLRESGYAKDYIRIRFCEIAKMTPKKYLTTIRMKRAKELLNLNGENVSIARIAEQCGIVDPTVFSKSFKQYYGMSPKKFLKNCKL